MAAVPDEILGKKVFKKVRASVFRYGVFFIILIELLCFLLKYLDIYTIWHFGLFSQLACLIFMINNNYNLKPKKLCIRKNIAYNMLIFYYFLGFVSILFSISNSIYNNIASFVILFVSFILMILSYKNE
jgi:hypothetical protein